MRKIIYLIILITLVVFSLKACIKSDTANPESEIQACKDSAITEYKLNKKLPNPKTVTINGIDYLQSQLPAGIYGNRFISTIIGEGPKTFNPFTAKDATSSQMAALMYDGLVSSNPVDGEVYPKLAKSVDVKGTHYIIHLRHGITWSDGSLITADDVMFTWKDIVFAGLGNTSTRDNVVIEGKLPELKKIDNYTVEFVLPKPFAPFLRQLSLPIAPKHYFTQNKNWQKNFDRFLSKRKLI